MSSLGDRHSGASETPRLSHFQSARSQGPEATLTTPEPIDLATSTRGSSELVEVVQNSAAHEWSGLPTVRKAWRDSSARYWLVVALVRARCLLVGSHEVSRSHRAHEGGSVGEGGGMFRKLSWRESAAGVHVVIRRRRRERQH